jgi:hypothetical protein
MVMLHGCYQRRIEDWGRQRAHGIAHVCVLPAPCTQRVCVCVCMCVRACVRACLVICVGVGEICVTHGSVWLHETRTRCGSCECYAARCVSRAQERRT